MALSSAQRAAQQKKDAKSPLNKQATPTRPTMAVKPSTRVVPKNSTATPNKTPVAPKAPSTPITTGSAVDTATKTTPPLDGAKANAQMFMSIISTFPPETKDRYLSAFTDFLSLPSDKQEAYLAGLNQQAKNIVAPQIKQEGDRLQQTYDYNKTQLDLQKANLQATYDKVIGQMDFNKARDIAKENKTAAQVMQQVTNASFITGVAGSGIASRRTQLAREDLQNNVDDTNISYEQNRSNIDLKKGQQDQSLDGQINRLYDLNQNDQTDLAQKQKQDELSTFLDLAGNEFGQKGAQDANLLQTSAAVKGANDFAAGGTDAQRQARYQNSEKYLSMTPDQIANSQFDPATLARVQKYVGYGAPTGESDGRVTFQNQPKDGNASDVSWNDWQQNWAPKVQQYQDIQSGKFKSDIRGQLRSSKS